MWIKLFARIIDLVETFYYHQLNRTYENILATYSTNTKVTIVDVGAHKGESIDFFKKLIPSTRFYSFEPSELTFKLLHEKFADDQEVTLLRMAVSRTTGESIFYESRYSALSSLLEPESSGLKNKLKKRLFGGGPSESYSVKTVSLDDFLHRDNLGNFSILKIDTEGSELEILKGSSLLLRAGVFKIIQLEIHRDKRRKLIERELEEFLVEFDYQKIAQIRHPSGIGVLDLLYIRR